MKSVITLTLLFWVAFLAAQPQQTFHVNSGLNYLVHENSDTDQGIIFQVGTERLFPLGNKKNAILTGFEIGYRSFYNRIEAAPDRSNYLRLSSGFTWDKINQWTSLYGFIEHNFTYKNQLFGLGVKTPIIQNFLFDTKLNLICEGSYFLSPMNTTVSFYDNNDFYGFVLGLGISKNLDVSRSKNIIHL